MHARVTMANVQPDRFDEAVAAVKETFQPAAREQRGFRAFMLLADPAARHLIGITLWETEADMAASEGASGYYGARIAEFNNMLVGPATTTTHEVAAFETEATGRSLSS
jgi:heme-degrading monooxygenase HmoA